MNLLKRLWCVIFHYNAPTSYNVETKMFTCMKCGVKWQK